ncbi:MAG TPA: hypothetical protein VG965_02405 [Patescibacteria group bacterium]|nr:hypothetical protein [Patescibacteria group bacterium]
MYYIIVNPERVYLPNDYISQEILNEQDYIIVTAQITEASQNVAEVELKPFFSHVFQVPIDDDELLEFYYHAFCPKSYCNQVRLIVKAKHFIVSDD